MTNPTGEIFTTEAQLNPRSVGAEIVWEAIREFQEKTYPQEVREMPDYFYGKNLFEHVARLIHSAYDINDRINQRLIAGDFAAITLGALGHKNEFSSRALDYLVFILEQSHQNMSIYPGFKEVAFPSHELLKSKLESIIAKKTVSVTQEYLAQQAKTNADGAMLF